MILISALLAAMSAWFFLTRRSPGRMHAITGVAVMRTSQSTMSATSRRLLSVGGGALLGWTLGDFFGGVIGALTGFWWSRVWRARESKPSVDRELAFARDSPVMLDLLCATLASGATIRDSMEAVRNAIQRGPVADLLSSVVAAIDLGADPREAWSPWIHHPVMGGLAQAITRSNDSGAALVEVLDNSARELRREHQRRVEVAARSAGVKAVLPLATCFLPAFFALGVVPIVASLANSTGLLWY